VSQVGVPLFIEIPLNSVLSGFGTRTATSSPKEQAAEEFGHM
jgi:hypothetical protein